MQYDDHQIPKILDEAIIPITPIRATGMDIFSAEEAIIKAGDEKHKTG